MKMLMQEITIHVDEEAANAYKTASLRRPKEDANHSKSLVERNGYMATADPALLKETMSRISRKVKERGLTGKILESLLRE